MSAHDRSATPLPIKDLFNEVIGVRRDDFSLRCRAASMKRPKHSCHAVSFATMMAGGGCTGR